MRDTPAMLRELNVVERRYQAVLEVLDGTPVTEVAQRFGVARQTVHRWVARYRESGLDGLADRSHAPQAHPWRVSAEIEAVICDLRTAHRSWGPRRLAFELERRGHPGVSRSTVYRVLVRYHLIEPFSRRIRLDQYRRWERSAAMELWQMDVTASLFLADGRECKVITGIDDHSRFCVIATVVMRATARAVCLAFTAAMTEYGIPSEVLTEDGKQFTGRFGKPRPAEVMFERICRENGITQRLTKPRSPLLTGQSLLFLGSACGSLSPAPALESSACLVDYRGSVRVTHVPCLIRGCCGWQEAGNAGGWRAGGARLTWSCATTTWPTWPTAATRRPACALMRSICCTSPAGWPVRVWGWTRLALTRCCGIWRRAGPRAARASMTT